MREEIGNYAKTRKRDWREKKGGDVEERGVRGEKWKKRVMMSVFAL